MRISRFPVFTAICFLIILGMLVVSCSDDDKPTAPTPTRQLAWAPLGAGTDGMVNGLTPYGNDLIVGGIFMAVGGASVNYIAAWNGSSWAPLGTGMYGTGVSGFCVLDLTTYDNKLIAGGAFDSAGGVSASNIAAWNGSSWAALGSGMSEGYVFGPAVFALTSYDNKLIAGGSFIFAGGVDTYGIAAWDGLSWAPLGTGTNGIVFALTVYDNKLIAGGMFTTVGGESANSIAAWDGLSWATLGTGTNDQVVALTVYDNKLIAGGMFSTAGGVSASNIAAWNGSSWAPLGTGTNGTGVYSLIVYDNKLIAGGAFDSAGGVSANNIAAWDGSSWAPLGTGTNGGLVFTLTIYDNQLIVGGEFDTAGGVSANNIAAWGPQ